MATNSDYYVLAATGGLIVLHASQVQPKNTSSVLIANLLGIAVATIAYWACGFAFAIGDGGTVDSNFFLSYSRFFLIDATAADYTKFATEAIILVLVIVIVNSGFAARMRCWIYPIVVIIVGGFLYPCVYHWTKASDGWLATGIKVVHDSTQYQLQYKEVYGSAIIHIFGGSCALIGTILVGTRKDRKDKKFAPLGGNVNPLIVVGGILALVGLVAKNNNSSLGLINNLLAAHGSAIVAFSFKRIKNCGDTSGTKALINGALAGVVGVSCAPDHYHPYGGFVIGVVAGLGYVAWTALFHCCRVDDPTDSAAVHLGAGMWAALAGPIFRKDTGVIYNGTTYSFEVFGWQLLGALAVFVWAGLTLFIIFIPFLCGKCATYKDTAAEQGLDVFEFDDPAFPDRGQYSEEYEANPIMEDIVQTRYTTKSYDNPTIHATLNTPNGQNWNETDQDWRNAHY